MAIRIHTAEELRAFDRRVAGEVGLPTLVLMENAGRGVARQVEEAFGGHRHPVAVVCGKGNNGGDGWVAARHLLRRGYDVHVWPTEPVAKLQGDARTNALVLEKLGFRELRTLDHVGEGWFVVDALFGSGLSRPLDGESAHLVNEINGARRRGATVVSIDLPSGLDANRHHPVGPHVVADLTVALHALKPALVQHPTREACGTVVVEHLGIGGVVGDGPVRRWLEPGDVLLSDRPVASHKGTAGHVLVFAGSAEKTGAAVLACRAAFRAGAGLVSIASSPDVVERVVGALPEVMTVPLAEVSAASLARALQGKDALVAGPGLVPGEDVSRALAGVLEAVAVPSVLDADALNAFAADPTALALLPESQLPPVLTPHPAEAARLLGVPTAEVQADRFAAATKLAKLVRAHVLLKGACTVIAHPDGAVDVLPFEEPALATAGSGDVLAGAIGSLLAQGASAADAAVAGGWLHGRAGERLAGPGHRGLLASDLADALPHVVGELLLGVDDGGPGDDD